MTKPTLNEIRLVESAPHDKPTGQPHVEAMLSSARCGAKTRAGTPCQAPAVSGRKRCRMHGGAPGSGAPKGNRNALQHGDYSAATKAEHKRINAITKRAMDFLKRF